MSVTNRLSQNGWNVESYAYTKMGGIANITDPNFVMNFSDDANKRETLKVKDFANTKISKIVPRDIFKGIFMTKGAHISKDENGKAQFWIIPLNNA